MIFSCRLTLCVLLVGVISGTKASHHQESIFNTLANSQEPVGSMLRKHGPKQPSADSFQEVFANQDDPSVVKTQLGAIKGEVLNKGRKFMSIPFAQPPTGNLRWESPRMVNPWAPKVIQATHEPPGCYQKCGLPPHACPQTISEDCLYLNVFTPPLEQIDEPLPVLIFIHGGNFRQGYSGGPLYDGTDLSNSSKIIVVTTNYRLGPFGFLYTGSGDNTSIDGSFGIQDQRMAMKFIKQNINAFGGNPSHVTIMGQSAGAQSVATHLIADASAPYFDAAMMVSEPMGLPMRGKQAARSWARLISSEINCGGKSAPLKDIETCLRSKDSKEILNASVTARKDIFAQLDDLLYVFNPWGPVVGSSDCPQQPLYAFGNVSSIVQRKPIITGTVANEGWMFIYEAFDFEIPSVLFDFLVPIVFGSEAGAKIKERYPVPAHLKNDTRPLLSEIATDGFFHCPVRHAMQALSNASTQNVWMYHFDHVASFSKQEWGPNFKMCWDKVCHAADLVFWFKPNPDKFGFNFTSTEYVLAESMQDYLSHFAKSYNPGNSPTEPLEWPQYNSKKKSGENMILFQTPSNKMQVAPNGPLCDYWDNQITYAFTVSN